MYEHKSPVVSGPILLHSMLVQLPLQSTGCIVMMSMGVVALHPLHAVRVRGEAISHPHSFNQEPPECGV